MKSRSTLKSIIKISLLVEVILTIISLVIKINHYNFPFYSSLAIAAMAGFVIVSILSIYWFFYTLFSKTPAGK